MPTTKAYAAFDTTSPLRPFEVSRREPRPEDVAIDILYCGICHSDLHQVRNDWGNAKFPMVPGHEASAAWSIRVERAPRASAGSRTTAWRA
jgi:alcohol dehydrogenase (NADP+)